MVLETIAAFLNSQGGTLLIGVKDDGTIIRIESDLLTFDEQEQDLDTWQQCLASDEERYDK